MSAPLRYQNATAPARQAGAATLAVVMVLFFVVSLVAAYAGRNIIFEQRTSSNQLQGTVSFEAAEAGLDWSMALLNSGRIDTNCTPSSSATDPTFRQRYLAIDVTNGNITPQPRPSGVGELWAACALSGSAWSCQCPASGAPTLSGPGSGLTPAFVVRFVALGTPPSRPGVVHVEVKGCTQPDPACLTFPAATPTACQGTVCAMAALAPGLKSAPIAAVTARGSIDVGSAALSVYNTTYNRTTQTQGVTILAGGTATPTSSWVLRGVPGTPPDRTVIDSDTALADAAFTSDRMFAASFGVWRETYWEQPGAVRLACGTGCDATMVRNAANMNPGLVLLADGDVALDGGGDIGSLAEPVVLVVKGNLTFPSPTTVYGFVYAETADWGTSGTGQIRGAAVAEGRVSGSGAYTIVYEPNVLDDLFRRTGSFVRVPGSWKDFR